MMGRVADPVLIACAHGTRSAVGQATYAALAAAIGAARPGLRVEPAFVDVQSPTVDEVVARLTSTGERVVVVPLLLSSGYHVGVDVARAIDGNPRAVAARAIGPDSLLVDLLLERLEAVDVDVRDADGSAGGLQVVVAAAGSSDANSRADVARMLEWVAARCPVPVRMGFAASAEPRVPDAVAAARAAGGPVAIAAYLLVPGYFHSVLAKAGADAVTEPLCTPERIDARIVELVLARFDAAAERFG